MTYQEEALEQSKMQTLFNMMRTDQSNVRTYLAWIGFGISILVASLGIFNFTKKTPLAIIFLIFGINVIIFGSYNYYYYYQLLDINTKKYYPLLNYNYSKLKYHMFLYISSIFIILIILFIIFNFFR